MKKKIIAEEKNIVDKKERYLNQYIEEELDLVKSGVLKFNHKNKPPVNSATSLVKDKGIYWKNKYFYEYIT